MALITTAPSTIQGRITSVNSYKTENAVGNTVIEQLYSIEFREKASPNRPLYGVKAIYYDEADQIASLSTQKGYGAFYAPVLGEEDEVLHFKVSFMGEEYEGNVDPDDPITTTGAAWFDFGIVEG